MLAKAQAPQLQAILNPEVLSEFEYLTADSAGVKGSQYYTDVLGYEIRYPFGEDLVTQASVLAQPAPALGFDAPDAGRSLRFINGAAALFTAVRGDRGSLLVDAARVWKVPEDDPTKVMDPLVAFQIGHSTLILSERADTLEEIVDENTDLTEDEQGIYLAGVGWTLYRIAGVIDVLRERE